MSEIHFTDEKLKECLQQWMEEKELTSLDAELQEFLAITFKEGWSACLSSVFKPAVDLCLFFMRFSAISKDAQDSSLTLNASVLNDLFALCRKVVGDVDAQDLKRGVEAVNVDDPLSES